MLSRDLRPEGPAARVTVALLMASVGLGGCNSSKVLERTSPLASYDALRPTQEYERKLTVGDLGGVPAVQVSKREQCAQVQVSRELVTQHRVSLPSRSLQGGVTLAMLGLGAWGVYEGAASAGSDDENTATTVLGFTLGSMALLAGTVIGLFTLIDVSESNWEEKSRRELPDPFATFPRDVGERPTGAQTACKAGWQLDEQTPAQPVVFRLPLEVLGPNVALTEVVAFDGNYAVLPAETWKAYQQYKAECGIDTALIEAEVGGGLSGSGEVAIAPADGVPLDADPAAMPPALAQARQACIDWAQQQCLSDPEVETCLLARRHPLDDTMAREVEQALVVARQRACLDGDGQVCAMLALEGYPNYASAAAFWRQSILNKEADAHDQAIQDQHETIFSRKEDLALAREEVQVWKRRWAEKRARKRRAAARRAQREADRERQAWQALSKGIEVAGNEIKAGIERDKQRRIEAIRQKQERERARRAQAAETRRRNMEYERRQREKADQQRRAEQRRRNREAEQRRQARLRRQQAAQQRAARSQPGTTTITLPNSRAQVYRRQDDEPRENLQRSQTTGGEIGRKCPTGYVYVGQCPPGKTCAWGGKCMKQDTGPKLTKRNEPAPSSYGQPAGGGGEDNFDRNFREHDEAKERMRENNKRDRDRQACLAGCPNIVEECGAGPGHTSRNIGEEPDKFIVTTWDIPSGGRATLGYTEEKNLREALRTARKPARDECRAKGGRLVDSPKFGGYKQCKRIQAWGDNMVQCELRDVVFLCEKKERNPAWDEWKKQKREVDRKQSDADDAVARHERCVERTKAERQSCRDRCQR